MKLFKFIFKLIMFLLLLVIIAVGVIIALAYDDVACGYDKEKTYPTLEEIIGTGAYDSIENVKSLSSEELKDSSKNTISIGMTTEDLNNYIVTILQSQDQFKEYMKTQDYILSEQGVQVESIFFEDYKGKLALRCRASGFGFYHTSILLSGDISTEEDTLVCKLNTFKLGKISIKRDLALTVINKLSLSFSNDMFDLKKLEIRISLGQYIDQAIAGTQLSDFISSAPYSMSYANSKVSINFDSTKLFVGKQEIKKVSPISEPKVDMTDITHPKIVINEGQFNYLVQSSMQNSEEAYGTSLSVGGKNFVFNLAGMYYEIANEKINANISINQLETACSMGMHMEEPVMKNGYVDSVTLAIDSVKIGDVDVSSTTNFQNVVIDADSLSFGGKFKIKNITMDKANAQCVMEVEPDASLLLP